MGRKLKSGLTNTMKSCALVINGGKEHGIKMQMTSSKSKFKACVPLTVSSAVSHFTESIVLCRGKLKRFWIGPLLTFTTVRATSRASFIPVDRYGHPKKVPKKEKVKLLTITCLFVKRKFNEIPKDFSIKGTLIQIWKSTNIFFFT